jgi:hypothetical protein
MGLQLASKRKLRKITISNRAVAERVYERMSQDLPINAKVAPMLVKDEAGDNILVFRSLRDDPLAAMHDRGQVDDAKYNGGRHWQRCHELVEIGGARAIDPTKEAVDGGGIATSSITDAQCKAVADMAKAGRALGQEGEAIIRDFLGRGMPLLHVAAARGLTTARELDYIGRRLKECLETLAIVFGYAMRSRG